MAEMAVRDVALETVWQMRQEVMYPGEPLDFVKLDDDRDGKHLGLYHNGQLVSVISLFVRNGDLQFRKFATRVEQQGRGYGSQLLAHVIGWARDNNIQKIWCNARTSATGLYERFGLTQTGPGWIKYGIEFIKMEKRLR